MRALLRTGLGRRLSTAGVLAITGAAVVAVGLGTTIGAGAAPFHHGHHHAPAAPVDCIPVPAHHHGHHHGHHHHHRHHHGHLPFCAPGSTTTTAPTTTTTPPADRASSTTVAPTTTTTTVAPTTTAAPTTVPVATTIADPPADPPADPTTTTTMAPTPCLGVIINGVCFFFQ